VVKTGNYLTKINFDLRLVIHIDSFIPIATTDNYHEHISTHYSAYITVTWYKHLNTFSLEIPLEKITRFKNDIILAMSELSVLTARRLAKITGKIISLIPSYGNICRIMCRNMLMIFATSPYWDEKINMNASCKEKSVIQTAFNSL
jgi:hypothetical protein